jgi:hypothetical protein
MNSNCRAQFGSGIVPEFDTRGQESEAANAPAAPAIADAFFDATGKPPRQLPLHPAYLKERLKA